MKNGVHPNYNIDAEFTCNSCKTVYVVGSTITSASIEVCSNCHPFYTGKQNQLVDSDDRISKFKQRLAEQDDTKVVRKRKKTAERKARTTEVEAGPRITLKDMLKGTSK